MPSTTALDASGARLVLLARSGQNANVAFDDHSSDKRFSDRIETVTVDSVFEWMQRAGFAEAPVVLKLQTPRARSSPN